MLPLVTVCAGTAGATHNSAPKSKKIFGNLPCTLTLLGLTLFDEPNAHTHRVGVFSQDF
jgi:hypothetical protein